MGILNKKNDPDKWEKKYFTLLDDSEALEKTNQLNEDLLCKTIIRLSLASTGFNKHLDPHLLTIRNQLKNGFKSDRLKHELEKFSTALMTLDESDQDAPFQDASLLFEFLFNHFPNQLKDIQHIESKYKKNGYANAQYLIIAINDLIDNIKNINPVIKQGTELDTLPLVTISADIIMSRLYKLLDGTEIPVNYEEQSEIIKQKLHNDPPIAKIIDETISFLLKIKKFHHLERIEMALFLSQLTDQLTELSVKATGVRSASDKSSKSRNQLDESLSSQMLDLQKSSKTATQLEPLKQLIHSRLESISDKIYKQRLQEDIERKKSDEELDHLTGKIYIMERELSLLNTKLKSAHQNATHDPLTGLPNRLAYDERFALEQANWKRYQTPMSLLIWDIDFFKKINDAFGHKAGDKTLILIAKLLSRHCRETDFVSRFGGEEFTMLLSNTNASSALESANNIRKIIQNTAFNSNGKKILMTVSCGITQLKTGDEGDSCFIRADKALYNAKENGRNQCIIL